MLLPQNQKHIKALCLILSPEYLEQAESEPSKMG